MTLLLCIAGLLALLLPGYTLWHFVYPDQRNSEHLLTALCFATATALCCGYALTFSGLDIFLLFWGAAAFFCIIYWSRKAASTLSSLSLGADSRWLLALLALALIARLLPTFFHEYPRGWDPYFHLLLARKILLSGGHINDWLPYESIPLTYPTGSHLILAGLARVTGAPLHELFKLLLAIFGALSVAQVFALTSIAARDRRAALLAAACFAFLPAYGSVGYYRWGGLPNLIGMYLLLGALTTLALPPRRTTRLMLPSYFIGICLVNHHVLASAVFIGFALLAYLAATRSNRPQAKILLTAALISLIPGGLYFLPRFSSDHSVAETGLLQYGEPVHTMGAILTKVGWGYLALVAAGALYLLSGWRRRQASPRIDPILLVTCATLLLLFCAFEYGGRALSIRLLGRPIAPFTPSRFLTDAIPLMAVFPGLLLCRIFPSSPRGISLALLLVALLSVENTPLYRGFFKHVVKPTQAAAYHWIRLNTTPDTVVLDRYIHAAYISGRVASNTPIPTSELWARALKRRTMAAILKGAAPPSAMSAPVLLVSGVNRGKQLWRSPDGSLFVSLIHQP